MTPYEQQRNRLIPHAKRYADKVAGKKPWTDAGWMPGVADGLSGWFDPQNGKHYLPDDAIAVNTMRNRKSRFGKRQ